MTRCSCLQRPGSLVFFLLLLLLFLYAELWLLLQQQHALHDYEHRLQEHNTQLSQRGKQLALQQYSLREQEKRLQERQQGLTLQSQLLNGSVQRLQQEESALQQQAESVSQQQSELTEKQSRLHALSLQLLQQKQRLTTDKHTLLQQQHKQEAVQKQLHCLRQQSLELRQRETLSTRARQLQDLEAAEHWAAQASHPEVQRALYNLQHPADCNTAKLFVLQYVDPQQCGHGCQVHYISVALSYAYVVGRTLVLDEKSFWFLRGDGAGEDFFHDYFRPLSWCRTEHAPLSERVHLTAEGKRKEAGSSVEDARILTADILYPWMIVHYQHVVPASYKQQGLDLFWWRAQLSYYILTPLPETWALIRAARAEACVPQFWPLIGIHSRQGSSVKLDGDGGRRRVYDSRAHIAAADQLAQQLTRNSSARALYLFLATEYEEEIQELEAAYPERFFISFAGTLQDLHSVLLDTGMSASERYKPYQQLHLIAIIHLFTLVQVHGFVCQLQSNYSRLVLELVKAVGGELPHLSLGGHRWSVDP